MNASSYTLAGVESGELFLMEIISLVNADTRATVGYLRESLSMLPSIVTKLNNDIKAINKYINNQVESLTLLPLMVVKRNKNIKAINKYINNMH